MNECRVSIRCPIDSALKKINLASIPIYKVKQRGAKLSFYCQERYLPSLKKLFTHPIYKFKDEKRGIITRLYNRVLMRFGVILGAIAFFSMILISQSFILRIKVYGTGQYLEDRVISILSDMGVKLYSVYQGASSADITANILSLPEVTFCSVKKKGAIYFVNVEVDKSSSIKVEYNSLKTDVDGVIKQLSIVCGSSPYKVGDSVKIGDTLIEPYELIDDIKVEGIAVGYCVIESSKSLSYACSERSAAEEQKAVDSTLLYAQDVRIIDVTCQPDGQGVVYEVNFLYTKIFSINVR